MAEPFKNMFREETVRELADSLAGAGPFDIRAFVADAVDGLDALELKDRVRHLSSCLRRHLDADYPKALEHIRKALPPPLEEAEGVTRGFIIWPLCQFVQDFGVEDPETSVPALYELTRRFSAEFAIRPFLIRYPDEILAQLLEWAGDPDQHVRRWVSEGSRPRLPWGQRLQFLVDDPTPVLPLLEALKDDPEEYVRRSVANNLNDIAKDHPEVVVDLCRRWLQGASRERERLVRHALRSLIKQGHPGALELLGYGPPELDILQFSVPPSASIGDSVQLVLRLSSSSDREQKLVIDYALHSPALRGRRSRKVFKWKTATVAAGAELVTRHRHSFKPISTRPTRPGDYLFELLINGTSQGEHVLLLAD